MEAPAYRVEEWRLSLRVAIFWTVLSTGLAFLGVILFAAIYALTRGTEAGFVLKGPGAVWAIIVTALTTVLLLVVHELVHGLAIRGFGGRPSYGAGVVYKIMPYFYCTANGHRLTRQRFAMVCAAPLLVVSLIGALCVAFAPYGGWLVVPLGFHLGGCIGDLWFLGLIFSQPRGTLFEDYESYVRILRTVA